MTSPYDLPAQSTQPEITRHLLLIITVDLTTAASTTVVNILIQSDCRIEIVGKSEPRTALAYTS